MLHYYLTQIPQILVILLPVSLLLALLFCLGRMSRANEIVSMLTAGVSLPRLLLPLLLIGLLTSLGAAALNYSLAPHAELARKFLYRGNALAPRSTRASSARFSATAPTTAPGSFNRSSRAKMNSTACKSCSRTNRKTSRAIIIATHATYHPETKAWELKNVKIVDYDAAGNIKTSRYAGSLTINDWSETPFRLAARMCAPDSLGVPELRDYLHFNSDFPAILLAPFATHLQYRLALPWTCLVVVFIAAPLGIGFSRRGILASVAAAIVLVFAMNFLTHLFLALGEGDRIQPWSRPGRRTLSSPSLVSIFCICARPIAKCRDFNLAARVLRCHESSSERMADQTSR